MAASKDELALCPGLGQVKVQKLHDAFNKPFSTQAAERLKKRRLEEEENKDDDKTASLKSGDNKWVLTTK